MANEIEEHVSNLLLIIVEKTAQFEQLVTRTYFTVG